MPNLPDKYFVFIGFTVSGEIDRYMAKVNFKLGGQMVTKLGLEYRYPNLYFIVL